MRRLAAWLVLALLGCRAGEPGRDVQAHIQRIEDELLPAVLVAGEPIPLRMLSERMEHHRVPAVSIAVINNGELEWARAYGLADVEEGRPATTRTLFQAASISKLVAALAALKLVEDGMLDPDESVNEKLESWKVPENEYTAVEPVTLRRLLTHTAGTTVHGFPGYAADETVPTTIEVLDGRGNTDRIRVDTVPGSIWRYSGGGYTIAQLLLHDVAGRPFPEIMRETVLEPIGMSESTYEQPLPEPRRDQAASGYGADGTRVEGKWHTYPEMAAAGLWTTPTDLARYAIEIQKAYAAEPSAVLSSDMARHMLEPGMNDWGLGPAIGLGGKAFRHDGSNEGFRCEFIAFIEGGKGAVVMTNSDRGSYLVHEIMLTIADEYDWPEFRPTEKTVVELDPAVLQEHAGRYELAELGVITIEVGDGGLWADVPGLGRVDLLPESQMEFFVRDDGTRVTFIREDGRVTAFRVSGMQAARIDG
jgi:CubicO group peptidase (beta-lactamase class C family)